MASTDNVESVKAGINVANLFHRITPMGQHENNFLVYCAREQINLTDKSVRDTLESPMHCIYDEIRFKT